MGTPGIPNTGYSLVPAPDVYNPVAGVYSPCGVGSVTATSGGMTYPCFRSGSTPVVVLLSDAPAHEGPGGQYPGTSTSFTRTTAPICSGPTPSPKDPAAGCPRADPHRIRRSPGERLQAHDRPVRSRRHVIHERHQPPDGWDRVADVEAITIRFKTAPIACVRIAAITSNLIFLLFNIPVVPLKCIDEFIKLPFRKIKNRP